MEPSDAEAAAVLSSVESIRAWPDYPRARAPIFLNVAQARAQFQRFGFVYTLRKSRSTGLTHARAGSFYKFDDLGAVDVAWVQPFYRDQIEELRCYLRWSGFRTIEQWVAEADDRATGLYSIYRTGVQP